MLNNCFQFLANILSLFLATTVDRRLLIVWGQFVCGAALFIGGTSLPGTNSRCLTTVCFMLVWGFMYQLTLGTVAWTLVAELASYRLRARTQGLANATLCLIQWTTGFSLPVHVQSGSGELVGEGGLCVWGDDVYWVSGDVLFPARENNRTALELDEPFERRVPTWDFKKYTFDDEGEIDSPRKQ
jgi:MFS transporter, SP family, general alpha glucoside:H+ symporter